MSLLNDLRYWFGIAFGPPAEGDATADAATERVRRLRSGERVSDHLFDLEESPAV